MASTESPKQYRVVKHIRYHAFPDDGRVQGAYADLYLIKAWTQAGLKRKCARDAIEQTAIELVIEGGKL